MIQSEALKTIFRMRKIYQQIGRRGSNLVYMWSYEQNVLNGYPVLLINSTYWKKIHKRIPLKRGFYNSSNIHYE